MVIETVISERNYLHFASAYHSKTAEIDIYDPFLIEHQGNSNFCLFSKYPVACQINSPQKKLSIEQLPILIGILITIQYIQFK